MFRSLPIDSLRARLTLFYVAVLAAALIVVGGLIYVLLAQALYARVDDNLAAVLQITTTSLANDLAEGQDVEDAARSTAAELSSRQQMLAIYDGAGRLLAEGGRDDDLRIVLPALGTLPVREAQLLTVSEAEDDDDRHRLAMTRRRVGERGVEYVIVAGTSLEPIDEELESLIAILAYVVPIALLLTAAGGWFLAQESLETSLRRQRQFMADASHELRTPVAISRTAASVALQQPRREEHEYREALGIIEQQTGRLSRIVDDMFTLARADAGNYPVRMAPMYLDEVIADAGRAAQVLASARQVVIDVTAPDAAAFTGDEELIRRLIGNLLDNAVRHAPEASRVRVVLGATAGGYAIAVGDSGPGIPPEIRPHIFERFYRGDAGRARTVRADGGAGLGLALARWVARTHGGDVRLADSSDSGTTFVAELPKR